MSTEKQSKTAVARLVVLILIVIALFLAMRFLPVQQWLRSFSDWVGEMGAAGILIFIVVYALATVLMAPGSILTIGAGFAFGLWKGFLAVSAGATLGASLAFLVARFIAREKIEAIAQRNEKFRNIDRAIGKQGAKLIFLLRLSPVIPFNLSNYFYGLTAVKFWPYVSGELDRHDARNILICLYWHGRQGRRRCRRWRRSCQTRLAVLDVLRCGFRCNRYRDHLGHEDCARRVEIAGFQE